MDFLYQFNLGLIAPLFTGAFHEMFEKKKKLLNFQKLAGLWLVPASVLFIISETL